MIRGVVWPVPGISYQEADKQKPNVIELISHFRLIVEYHELEHPNTSRRELMNEAISAYNLTVKKNRKLQIGKSEKTVLISLFRCPEDAMLLLERHYQKYKHAEAAMNMSNMATDAYVPGMSRFKGKDENNRWHNIKQVCEESVVTWFARNIGSYEKKVPKGCATKVKRMAHKDSKELIEVLDLSLLHSWIMNRLPQVLNAALCAKYAEIWMDGLLARHAQPATKYRRNIDAAKHVVDIRPHPI